MNSILAHTGEKTRTVPKVKSLRPFGSSILIEHLSPREQMGTDLFVGEEAKVDGAPQAYIVAFGPKIGEDCGLKIGDRVVVQGTFVPVPNTSGNKRVRGIVEVHNIKAILDEE